MWFRISTFFLSVVLVAGCGASPETEGTGAAGTTSPPPTTAEPQPTPAPITTTTATTAAPPTTATTTTISSNKAAPTTSTASISDLESGLFCRDLFPMGFAYEEAVAYWVREGSPDRMDADRNGIPCETVYPPEDVVAFWGEIPSSTTQPASVVYKPPASASDPPPLSGSGGAAGSGCAPGSNTLPNGIWFGFVTARSGSGIEFDLACLFNGEAAVAAAAEDGTEPYDGTYVRNQSSKIRSVPASSDAEVHHFNPDGGPVMIVIPYSAWLDGPCNGMGLPSCPVWIYVNGSRITAITERFFS